MRTIVTFMVVCVLSCLWGAECAAMPLYRPLSARVAQADLIIIGSVREVSWSDRTLQLDVRRTLKWIDGVREPLVNFRPAPIEEGDGESGVYFAEARDPRHSVPRKGWVGLFFLKRDPSLKGRYTGRAEWKGVPFFLDESNWVQRVEAVRLALEGHPPQELPNAKVGKFPETWWEKLKSLLSGK